MMRRIALLTAAFMALGGGTAMAADITYTGAERRLDHGGQLDAGAGPGEPATRPSSRPASR